MKEFICISDEKSFIDMYDTYSRIIYSYLLTKLTDISVAEDLTSDVLFKVFNNRFSYNPSKAKFSTWIFNIAKNALIDYIRKNRLTSDIDDEIYLTDDTDIEEEFIANENAESLRRALSGLTIREYNIVYMRYYRELNYKQIAEEMSLNESNVSVILTRSLKKLKKLLKS